MMGLTRHSHAHRCLTRCEFPCHLTWPSFLPKYTASYLASGLSHLRVGLELHAC